MIREIKYVCTASVDYFTCHALFSRITDGALSKLKLNSYSKQPQYRIYFQDRTITILINEHDINLLAQLPTSIDFNHNGKILTAILYSDIPYEIKNLFKNGDFVFASGVISYAKNLNTKDVLYSEKKIKHQSPINPHGEILKGEKKSTIEYLENKLGIDLNSQISERTFRFEIISYKHFESNKNVYSKSNNNKLSLHNVFSFELQGFVKNCETINSLEYTSIGKKRSYGFGNVYLK